jgi:transcriptional regulator with XRE-family HTH domain
VANYLKEQRLRAGLLQEELAKKAGVGKSTIVKIETGVVQPRRDTCQRLAKALGIKPGLLATKLAGASDGHATQPVWASPDAPSSRPVAERRASTFQTIVSDELTADQAEALLFLLGVRLFEARLEEHNDRPEVYAGYAKSAKRCLIHAELIARALFFERDLYPGTWELGIEPEERSQVEVAYRRWSTMAHGAIMRAWSGLEPPWEGELEELVGLWNREVVESEADQDEPDDNELLAAEPHE